MNRKPLLAVAILTTCSLQAQEGAQLLRDADRSAGNTGTSPVLRIQRSLHRPRAEIDPGGGFPSPGRQSKQFTTTGHGGGGYAAAPLGTGRLR